MKKVIVIGGGASGLMAAYTAAKHGNAVTLLEKNEKAGKKLYITGKGRGNLTNDCAPDEFLENVVRGKKFLTGAVYAFPPRSTMDFFEKFGLLLKVERGNRVFPVSDHASDITKTLLRACSEVGVEILYGEEVTGIKVKDNAVRAVHTQIGEYKCDAVIVATGGLSYPSTGSTGDGYLFAERAGHTIINTVPSLVGLETKPVLSQAQGVTLKNVTLTARRAGKVISSRMGELLFTHYGISGPLVLSLSAEINRLPLSEIALILDFKPALDEKMLDARLLRDFTERKNEQMKSVLRGLLPMGLVSPVLREAGIAEEKRANSVTREERERLKRVLKQFPLLVRTLRGYSEAVVTSGGVSLTEINPKSMESKLVKGLFFCGEVLDVDAYTGGYNMQIAFSSGYVAGNHV